MTNYEKLFGTPERAARTLWGCCVECFAHGDEGAGCTACPVDRMSGGGIDVEGVLEWLENEVRDD